MTLRRLHPDPAGDLAPGDVIAGLRLADLAPPGRPYVVCNMVASLDGQVALQGRSGGLASELDREVFHLLRTQADAVMVGTGTLRAERYGRMVRDPARRERRVAEGLEPDPIAFMVSRTLEVPWDIPLFEAPEQTVVIATFSDASVPDVAADVHLVRMGADELTMATALERLRADFGVRSVLCEGGPLVNAALLRDGVLDELFLSLSPVLVGAEPGMTMVAGTLHQPTALELVWTLEGGGMLFLRYRVTGRD